MKAIDTEKWENGVATMKPVVNWSFVAICIILSLEGTNASAQGLWTFQNSGTLTDFQGIYFLCDSTDSVSWYPLKVGNRWDYYWNEGGGSDYYSLESVYVSRDTVMPNSQGYFKLSHIYMHVSQGDTSGPSELIEYQRIDDSSDVYSYDVRDSCESLQYRLGLPLGGTDLVLQYGCGYYDTTLCYFDSVYALFRLNIFGDTALTKRIERSDTTIGYGARLWVASVTTGLKELDSWKVILKGKGGIWLVQ